MLRATPGWSSTITTSRCRNCAQRWSEQDHQRWRYHRRLLDYQSHDSHLKLPFVIRTLGDHQYLWIIQFHIVIWNYFLTAIYFVHQRPHFFLKILLDHQRLGGSSTFIWDLLLPTSRQPLIGNIFSFFRSLGIGVQFVNFTTPPETFRCLWLKLWQLMLNNYKLISYHIRPILLLYSIWKYRTCRGTTASGWGI